jgi:hypothetical protein
MNVDPRMPACIDNCQSTMVAGTLIGGVPEMTSSL